MVSVVSVVDCAVCFLTPHSFPRPPYASFELSLEDATKCVDHVKRAIVMASWLAAVSRRELVRFKEFILWLRYGNRRPCCIVLRPIITVFAHRDNNCQSHQ